MKRHRKPPQAGHEAVQEQYDAVQADGRYAEGMARMALYHHHCQDPVIFRALGDIRGKSLLDLACNGGLLRFHPGGFDPERKLTLELRRWDRDCINSVDSRGSSRRILPRTGPDSRH